MRIHIPKSPSSLLYLLIGALALFYVYFFLNVNGSYQPNGTDEFLYSLEARAIAQDNHYKTPISFDGVTSKIGHFGIHGILYASLDGWWAKLWRSDLPNILALNFLIAILAFYIIFKNKSISTSQKLLLAGIIITYHALFRYTFSFYKETIQILWGLILSFSLVRIYQPEKAALKRIGYFILLVLLYTQFRYNGFLWIFGLVPLCFKDRKALIWLIPTILLVTILGVLSNLLFVAPFPYPEVFNYVFMESLKTKPVPELIGTLYQHFSETLNEFLFQHESWQKMVMRYCFVFSMFFTGFYAYKQRSQLLWAVLCIELMYLLTTLAFYHAHWELDIRSLSVLIGLIGLMAVRQAKPYWAWMIIAAHVAVLPNIIETTSTTIAQFKEINRTTVAREQRIASLKDISRVLNGDTKPIVQLPVNMFLFNQANIPIYLPLHTQSGNPIHYTIYRGYYNPENYIAPTYTLFEQPSTDPHHQLISGSNGVYLYKII